MSLLNKFKEFKDLKAQAKTLQSALAQEKVEVENSGVKLIMDGNQKVTSLTIAEGVDREKLERIIPELFNQAIEKVQRIMAAKMQSGEFKFPGF